MKSYLGNPLVDLREKVDYAYLVTGTVATSGKKKTALVIFCLLLTIRVNIMAVRACRSLKGTRKVVTSTH